MRKIWFIFFSVPFAFLYFINIVNQKSYDIKVSLDVSFIFVSMAFIGILIMGYPDLKKELANRSKEKKLVKEQKLELLKSFQTKHLEADLLLSI